MELSKKDNSRLNALKSMFRKPKKAKVRGAFFICENCGHLEHRFSHFCSKCGWMLKPSKKALISFCVAYTWNKLVLEERKFGKVKL